jgi:restriction endonuclease
MSLENIKVYAKLPNWFKIDTPLGTYNPDWAILFEKDNEEKLYFVVESKGTLGIEFLRPAEKGKIDCGIKAHSVAKKKTLAKNKFIHRSDWADRPGSQRLRTQSDTHQIFGHNPKEWK